MPVIQVNGSTRWMKYPMNRYFFGDMVAYNLDDIGRMASPKVLRSHLPLSLLNPIQHAFRMKYKLQ